jgi:hypothetical protein
MKKAKSVALICAGNLTDSPLPRFRWLSDRLGPVKSPSFRLASRVVNTLKAGQPVKNYADLDPCRLILVCVPDEILPDVVGEMASAEISWRGKSVVLCSAWLDSSELREFGARGASVGSICTIPGFDDRRYLIEGDKLAIRESRRLVEHWERRAVTIERLLKPFFLAALTCTGTLLFAVLVAASESLRHAGVPASLSTTIIEKQLGRSLRAYARGGRRAYPAPRHLSRQLRALVSTDPALAQFIEQGSLAADKLVVARQRAVAGG